MPALDNYTVPLTAKTAAHLLRRATFGPTQAEITAFTGLTATQAVQQLIANARYTVLPPIDLDSTKPTAGQTYIDKPFDHSRNFYLGHYLRHWWLGLMTTQAAPPSLLDKLALFWQNHFVTTRNTVEDYRFVYQYLVLLRNNALGNFRTFVTKMTKEPAMLRYLNGNENEVGKPNENYARELQELFTVGAVDFAGNKNYTEDDVKAAAKVLTGWQYTNHNVTGSVSFKTTFTDSRHDASNKTFSAHYANTVITGRAVSEPGTTSAGDAELNDLVDMLLRHPQTPRYICRKLYRWYVNPTVTQAIEDTVIGPLAEFFASPANNYAIQPVVSKLLTSQVFFDPVNIGSMIKSPLELTVGALRFFNQPVPELPADYAAFGTYFDFVTWRVGQMQMDLIDQATVFGYDAYYQTGFSKLWINTSTVGLRGDLTDTFIWRWLQIKPGYMMGIDLLAWVTSMQPNFSDVAGTPAISCSEVLTGLTKNLFVVDLFPAQQDFLIDTIMMQGIPRTSWQFEWNRYRRNPTNSGDGFAVLWRLQNLMKYMLRMAEYQVF
ncbi:DUF1800 domain-containing protein [Spirosoma montaniterrae]|uniref:DUF1800 domain-containing protein n=1 Tax=Spirosoma montaniterrae TaxID=1178516 RepID=A0A1P9WU42_9BACT|nr:DUF1800 domain-containing protein [Spirosoma montaniterrae]AQG78897.1 hypothetical protein AWR27_05885 [Spirosoma montaniterrae]